MTILELIDELRAASEVVGADADVEAINGTITGVITGTRSATLDIDDGDRIEREIARLQQELDDAEDEAEEAHKRADKMEDAAEKALLFLRDESGDKDAVIVALEKVL